jgi:ketosteroid isomerase-like protein
MKARNGIRWTLLATLSALSVCATSSTLNEKAPPADKPRATASVKLDPGIQLLYSQFSVAFAKRDINAIMAVFDKSATLSYQGAADTHFDEIKAGFEYDFKNDPPGTTWTGFPEESHQEGNLAIVIAHWEYYVMSNGTKLRRHRIRSVDVLNRSSGQWKIVRTVNYPED